MPRRRARFAAAPRAIDREGGEREEEDGPALLRARRAAGTSAVAGWPGLGIRARAPARNGVAAAEPLGHEPRRGDRDRQGEQRHAQPRLLAPSHRPKRPRKGQTSGRTSAAAAPSASACPGVPAEGAQDAPSTRATSSGSVSPAPAWQDEAAGEDHTAGGEARRSRRVAAR